MNKFSISKAAAVVLTLAAMAMMAVGASRENFALAASGVGFGFVVIIAASFVSSVIKINKQFPSRGDPAQRKARAARYFKLASSFVITAGVVIMAIGFFMNTRGVDAYLHIAWATLAVGVVMSVVSSVITMAYSNEASVSKTVLNGAPRADVPAPYSPDPVVSRILAHPRVLTDERIRGLREVQNLLQYPEIQQIFFEPTKLYELFGEPRVSELLDVVRGRLTQADGEEIFAAAERRSP